MERRKAGRFTAGAVDISLYAVSAIALLSLAACGDQGVPVMPVSAAAAVASAQVGRSASSEGTGASQSRSNSSGSLITIEEITVTRGGLATIDPCWLVNRGILNADQHNGNFSAEFTFSYLSRGAPVTLTFTVGIRNGETIPPEPVRQQFGASRIELRNSFNLGDAIPDSPGAIVGSVLLVKTVGLSRSIEGESTLTVQQ